MFFSCSMLITHAVGVASEIGGAYPPGVLILSSKMGVHVLTLICQFTKFVLSFAVEFGNVLVCFLLIESLLTILTFYTFGNVIVVRTNLIISLVAYTSVVDARCK